jgi:hypothetical protein
MRSLKAFASPPPSASLLHPPQLIFVPKQTILFGPQQKRSIKVGSWAWENSAAASLDLRQSLTPLLLLNSRVSSTISIETILPYNPHPSSFISLQDDIMQYTLEYLHLNRSKELQSQRLLSFIIVLSHSGENWMLNRPQNDSWNKKYRCFFFSNCL